MPQAQDSVSYDRLSHMYTAPSRPDANILRKKTGKCKSS
jgi:hypothetical protein